MTKARLALCLLVKNEAHTIKKTLDSVSDVADYVVVYDTGSTDGTQAIAASWRRDGMRCASVFVEEGEFENYASARNRVLDAAHRNRSFGFYDHRSPYNVNVWRYYALSLSADEVLVGGEQLRKFIDEYEGDESAFFIEVRATGGLFDYPRLLRLNHEDGPASVWRYEGEVHEVPKYQPDPARQPVIKVPGCRIEYVPTDPVRHAARLKDYDLPALSRMLKKANSDSDRVRYLLLLAQTYEALASIVISGKTEANAKDVELEAIGYQAQALGYYLYIGQTSEDPNLRFKLLNVADTLGIYSSQEMLARLRALEQAHPGDAAVAYMIAVHSANLDARAGLSAARRAAKIAEAAVVDKNNPYDPHGLLWRPHYLAALCAKTTGDVDAMRVHAAEGMRWRGPETVFKEFV